MGKRKKSSRKPAASTRQKVPLDTSFTCLFCHHEKSVTVRLDRKEGVATLVCRVCDQRYQSKVNHLTEPVDIYSEWIDAADQILQQNEPASRRPAASSSRPATAPASDDDSDD